MELLRLLDLNEVIVQAVNFLLVFFLLKTFLWKRILGALDGRKERIASEFKNIETVKQQVADLKAAYEAKMRVAEAEGKLVIQHAATEADAKADQIRIRAQKDALAMIENAKVSMRQELVVTRQELRNELVDLILQATGNLIEEKLTEDQDKKLVDNFLRNIESTL